MANKDFPTLYKKTSTGAIQEWTVSVLGKSIATSFGQVGGKIQTTLDTVKIGKNAGRANATGPEEQALKEAESQWTKKKKSGYVETIGAARAGETDAVIEGGVLPMLAKVYEDHESKVTYPVAVQPKLDGHRCIALLSTDGRVTLWSRTRKPITSVPHIVEKLEYIASKSKNIRSAFPLDGELYNNDLKEDFEKITSIARKQKGVSEDAKLIQFHVYDCVQDLDFTARNSLLGDIVILGGSVVELVSTKISNSAEESAMYFTLFKKLGYEGSMVRLLGIPYENKRSAQLLKVKDFSDEEFLIVGVEEGRGKLQGHGIFVCETKEGKKFNVKMAGETAKLKEYWEFDSSFKGKMLTVQFQGRTGDGIPRFPVGLRLREDV